MPHGNVYPITQIHTGCYCPPEKDFEINVLYTDNKMEISEDEKDSQASLSDKSDLGTFNLESFPPPEYENMILCEKDDNINAKGHDSPMSTEIPIIMSPVSTKQSVTNKSHPVQTQFLHSWLNNVYAIEPVFFPGKDNKHEIHQVPAPLRQLVHELNKHIVTEEDKQAILKSFRKEMRLDGVLASCGACGIRKYSNVRHDGKDVLPPKASVQDISNKKILATSTKQLQDILKEFLFYEGEKYHLMLLSDLSILQLDDADLEAYNNIPEMYKPAVSTYLDVDTSTRYHLHSEFIQLNDSNKKCVWICDSCHCEIQNEKIPEISIAGKRDFGRPDRVIIRYELLNEIRTPVYLPDLSILEMLVLSSARPFGVLISLTTSTGMVSGDALVGHVIIFSIDSLSKVTDVLIPSKKKIETKNAKHTIPSNLDEIPEILHVTFLGKEPTFLERVMTPLSGFVYDLSVKSEKILPWCHFIQAFYPDEIVVDDSNLQTRLDNVRETIMNKAHIGEDAIDKEMYETLESQHARPPIKVEPNKTMLGDARYMHDSSSIDDKDATVKILTALKKFVPNE